MQATLGLALAWTGRSQQGLALLNQAVEASRGGPAGRVLCGVPRSSRSWAVSGGSSGPEPGLPYFRRAGDTVWEARSLTHRGEVSARARAPPGGPPRISPAPRNSSPPAGRNSSTPRPGTTAGWPRFPAEIFPRRSPYLDEAGNRYDELGETSPDLAIDRCSALLAAGLAAEAARESDTALGRITPGAGSRTRRRSCSLPPPPPPWPRATRPKPGSGPSGPAAVPGAAPPPWEARASLVLAEARYAAGEHSSALFRYAERSPPARRLPRREAMQAHLLAGRIALTRGA